MPAGGGLEAARRVEMQARAAPLSHWSSHRLAASKSLACWRVPQPEKIMQGVTGIKEFDLRGNYGDTNCPISRRAADARLSRPDPPRPLRHTPSRRPHGSMNFRNFEAVNGLRPPEAAREKRAIDSLKTSEKGGFHEVDGAPCRTCAASCARALSRQLR